MKRQSVSVAAALTVFIIFGSGVAQAQVDPADCRIIDHHFSKPPPIDLGAGFVTSQTVPLVFSSGSFRYQSRIVTSCSEAVEIHVVYIDDRSLAEPGGFYAREAAVQYEDMLSNRNFQTIHEFRIAAEALGLPVREQELSQEDCGCAAFYPEMRGTLEAARVPMLEARLRAAEPEPDRTPRPLRGLSFIAGDLFFETTTAMIVSSYSLPFRLGDTGITGYGYRDFKDCSDNRAVRVQYVASGDAANELARGSRLAVYGGMAAVRFESALADLDSVELNEVILHARSSGLSADYSDYAVEALSCEEFGVPEL